MSAVWMIENADDLTDVRDPRKDLIDTVITDDPSIGVEAEVEVEQDDEMMQIDTLIALIDGIEVAQEVPDPDIDARDLIENRGIESI
jgi:hypothetical protein